MPSFGTIARKVMGLPEPADPDNTKEAAVPRQGDAPRSANPWESAGAELRKQQQTAPAPAVSRDSKPVTPWVPQDERSGAVFARRFGRGLLWFVLLLAAITGVRSWFFPAKAPAPKAPTVSTAPAYPDAEAQAVAARFARAYLGWDESNPDERVQLLASVLAADSDTTMGWDGHGRQDVLAVQPDAVTTGTDHQARVRVDVLIQPGAAATGDKGKKTAATSAPARWVGLDVPVVETSGRVIVTGPPGLVGIPKSGPKAPDLPTTKTDPDLSTQTQDTVQKFFQAYATGGTDAVTAPGASVPDLPNGITFKSLVAWSADTDTGSGDDRTGTARVSWSLGGASIEQVYRVTLTRVSSSDAQRWQVADVHGGSQ
ncbi:conjugal transfer protein [Streptomyces yokosukanensis]|uniref:conjugal transfer protein n=1 Tax=Streptomyces yokosukanensis TaxID=67386 RepID=UPI0034454D7A